MWKLIKICFLRGQTDAKIDLTILEGQEVHKARHGLLLGVVLLLNVDW